MSDLLWVLIGSSCQCHFLLSSWRITMYALLPHTPKKGRANGFFPPPNYYHHHHHFFSQKCVIVWQTMFHFFRKQLCNSDWIISSTDTNAMTNKSVQWFSDLVFPNVWNFTASFDFSWSNSKSRDIWANRKCAWSYREILRANWSIQAKQLFIWSIPNHIGSTYSNVRLLKFRNLSGRKCCAKGGEF